MANTIVSTTAQSSGSKTVAIGHSMGGVAFREIVTRRSPGFVGGVVTVGSPLNGAAIANRLANGDVSGFIRHGVDELRKGPLRELLGLKYIIVRAGARAFTSSRLQEVLFEESGIDNILFPIANNTSVRDLQVGSPYMQQATRLQVNVPNISLFGNENSPVHYRLASSFFLESDEVLPKALRDARGVYNTFYIKNVALYLSPINVWKASGWKAGRDFLDKSEKEWNSLIGATRTESITSCYNTFTCAYDWYYPNCTNGNYQSACDNCWRNVCEPVTRVYNEVSDGLLNASTQKGESSLAILSNWNADKSFEVIGANHNEYNNHPNAVNRYGLIFQGQEVNSVFIRLPR